GTGPAAVAYALAEAAHALEHCMHVRDDIAAVDLDAGAERRAQGHVQRRPVFGDIDVGTAEHGFDARGHAAFPGQGKQQAQGVVADALLRIIQVPAGPFCSQAFAPGRIAGETLTQGQPCRVLRMRLQCTPCTHAPLSLPAPRSWPRSAATAGATTSRTMRRPPPAVALPA